jgi:hypothetical protein
VLIVPEKYNRNNLAVRAMGPPADTGLRLLQHICTRIGIGDLSGLEILDFGCGCRFAEAIVNRTRMVILLTESNFRKCQPL